MKFTYNLEGSKSGKLDETLENFYSQRDPKISEKIEVRIEKDGSVSVLGNKEGWLYLAHVCVEMAYASGVDPLFHLHKKSDLSISMENGEEQVGFFLKD